MYILYLMALISWIIFIWTRRKFYQLSFRLPGSFGLPLIGVGHKIRSGERLLSFLSECKEKYQSPMVSWLGLHCMLIVSDADSVKTIMTSENCLNKSYIYKFLEYPMGTGAFTSNVPVWNQRYKILKPAFHNKILSSYLNIFNVESDNLIKKLEAKIDTEESQIYETFKKFTLEIACQTTMGKQIFLENDEFNAILTAFCASMVGISDRMYKPWIHPKFIYENSPMYKRDLKSYSIINQFMDKLIEHKKKLIVEGNQNESIDKAMDCDFTKSKDIFIDQITKYVENGQLTWKDVKDEANVIIAAAFETTSITLYLVFLCIAMHPEYQEKLHQEILDIFPEKNFNVFEEDLDNMTYTEMLIKESMRYIAPVPVVARLAMNDFELSDNTTIPKGTQILIDIFNLHRDQSTWGADADTFNPDHFLPENVKNLPPYAFIPFTKGLRMCLGHKYAMNLMKITVAKIFRNFEVTTNSRYGDLVFRANISMKLQNYPTFFIKKRA